MTCLRLYHFFKPPPLSLMVMNKSHFTAAEWQPWLCLNKTLLVPPIKTPEQLRHLPFTMLSSTPTIQHPSDVTHPLLLNSSQVWRHSLSSETLIADLPVFCPQTLSNTSLNSSHFKITMHTHLRHSSAQWCCKKMFLRPRLNLKPEQSGFSHRVTIDQF